MKYVIEQISDLLKQANALAETLHNFKCSEAEVNVSCKDSTTLVITENLHNYSDGTTSDGSTTQANPPPTSAADQLGQIKKNVWF